MKVRELPRSEKLGVGAVTEARGLTCRFVVVGLPAWSRALTEIDSVRLSLSAHVTCPKMTTYAA